MPENESEPLRPPGPDPGSAAAGPLVVSEANPRYFTVASGTATDGAAVYLTGTSARHPNVPKFKGET